MMRLFVALALPAAIRQRLATLGGGIPGARWETAANLHLTLRFVGELPEDQAADLTDALSAIAAASFDLTVQGVGFFGAPRKPRLVWAGIKRSEALEHLQGKVDSVTARGGWAADDRRFAPHITLARLTTPQPDRVGRFIEERALFQTPPFRVDQFVLFESLLGHDHAVYRPVRVYPLAA